MSIDGGMRKQLAAGMRLVASYRKETHTAEVIEGEEGKLRFRLADGREFTSPSAAGAAVMGGIACNGWRFWSLSTDEAEEPKPVKQARAKATKTSKPTRSTGRSKAKPEASSDTDTEVGPAEQVEPTDAEPVAAE
jgi:hypothetical protein